MADGKKIILDAPPPAPTGGSIPHPFRMWGSPALYIGWFTPDLESQEDLTALPLKITNRLPPGVAILEYPDGRMPNLIYCYPFK